MSKYIGNREFYKSTLAVAIPIIVQNSITNFVGLLDNVMVGRVGTEQMSGVAIINQLLFVFNIALFGAVSGPGIFTAQYAGQKNHEGVRNTMRFKIVACLALLLAGTGILYFFRESLINFYLYETTEQLDLAATYRYAEEYLLVMLIGLIPFAAANAYSSTLRETGQTRIPMIAGIIATGVNLVLNYILIFGHFGAPKLGVVGAAVASVIARFIEFAFIAIWTHGHKAENPYIVGLFKHFRVPLNLTKTIIYRGAPLFANEFIWSLGMSVLAQRYATRGLDVVAAINISNTIFNLFNVVMISMGAVVAIIIGQLLGAGKLDEAVENCRRQIAFAIMLCTCMGLLEFILAPVFPLLYETTDSIREMATKLMRIGACFAPVGAFLNTAYFTLRSGGKTLITFAFDSGFMLVVSIPVAFALSSLTDMPILPLFLCIQLLDLLKVVFGYYLLKKRIWLNNLVAED